MALSTTYFSGLVVDSTGLIVKTDADTFTAASKTSRGGFVVSGRLRLWGQVVDIAGTGFNPNAPNWGSLNASPEGVVSIPFEFDWDMPLSASPVAYALTAGSLPTGLSLGGLGLTGGRIYGTPTVAGTYTFTLRATNAYGTADKALSIVITTASGGGSYCFAA